MLLDTGAGISDVVLYTVSLADEVLVVATPEPTSLTDAYATIKVLATHAAAAPDRLRRQPGAQRRRGRAVRGQLQLVIDRYVKPAIDGGRSQLELLGEMPDRSRGARRGAAHARAACSAPACPPRLAAAGGRRDGRSGSVATPV